MTDVHGPNVPLHSGRHSSTLGPRRFDRIEAPFGHRPIRRGDSPDGIPGPAGTDRTGPDRKNVVGNQGGGVRNLSVPAKMG